MIPSSLTRFSPWPLVIATVIGVTAALVGFLRYAPPPLPAAGTPERQAHQRIVQIMHDLVGDGLPHPAGSEQNRVVRERIVAHVEALGLVVEQHATSALNRRTQQPVPLVNLLVFLPGTEPAGTIALASHHDSTPNGPGAADDAAAVAISLELLRYYQANPPKNNLLMLITDGEELGLLGAEKFVREHPRALDIDLLVNLEARGTSGPSCMFETADASLWSIQHYAAIAQRPITSSLFYEVYRLLPNNTDFTRYKELPIQGWNFAFIGSVLNYHTPQDTVDNVDPRSIYHHTQHAAGLLARLAHAETLSSQPGRAVYFDFLGWGVIHWPQSWALPLAALTTLLALTGCVSLAQRNRLRPLHLLSATAGLGLTLLILLAGLVATFYSLQWQDHFSPPWPNYPLPLLLVFWVVSIGLLLACGWLLQRRRTEIYLLMSFVWLALLWLTSIYVPGASYLFLLPALGHALGAWVVDRAPVLAATLAWASIALLWLPLEPLFYDALGFMNRDILLGRLFLLHIGLLPACLACHTPVATDQSDATSPQTTP